MDRPMRFLTAAPTRVAMILVVGCLATGRSWGFPALSTDTPPASGGSCEEVAVRQSSAYIDRLKAKEYAAASEIARKTADICLEAGDVRRAKQWFLTARGLGARRSSSSATQDEQFRQRYQRELARLRPREDSVAAAERRMAARQGLDPAHNPQKGASTTVSTTISAKRPVLSSEPTDQSDWAHVSGIAAMGGVGLFVIGAIALLGRNRIAALRRLQR
jgi:hypothetical protein